MNCRKINPPVGHSPKRKEINLRPDALYQPSLLSCPPLSPSWGEFLISHNPSIQTGPKYEPNLG